MVLPMFNKSVICVGESEEALQGRADRMREFFVDLEAKGKESYAEYDTDYFDFVGRQLGTGKYEVRFRKDTDEVNKVTDFCNMRKETEDGNVDCSPLNDLHMNVINFQPSSDKMVDDMSKKGKVREDIAYRGFFM